LTKIDIKVIFALMKHIHIYIKLTFRVKTVKT